MHMCTKSKCIIWYYSPYNTLYSGPFTHSRSVGRPIKEVDATYIEYLQGLLFSFTEIAKIMGISRATLYRILDDAGIDLTPALPMLL